MSAMDLTIEPDSVPQHGRPPAYFKENADVHGFQWQKNLLALDDDCWRKILDYLSMKDIIRLERVCRQWQGVVYRYFQGTRLRIETITNHWDVDEARRRRKCRTLILKDDPICFNAAINKWGSSVVELVYNAKLANEVILWNLGLSCPNLENITVLDSCIGEFLKNNTIEELVFRMCEYLYGKFLLTDPNEVSKLKTLVLSRCPHLNYIYLESAVDPVNRLAGVTKLELRDLPGKLHSRAGFLINKLPQLEHLTIDGSAPWFNDEVINAVYRLDHLKELGWHNNQLIRGNELEFVLKDATRLRACFPAHRWQKAETL